MKKSQKPKGITLIALVVTIIVLLVIAMISIAAISGENGLIHRVQIAQTATSISEERKVIEESSVLTMNMSKDGIITQDKLQKEINKYTGEGKTEITDGTVDTLIVTFIDSQRHYEVNIETGDVRQIDNIITVEDAKIEIICEPSGWTNQNVSVTIKKDEKYSDFDVFIRAKKDKVWRKITEPEILETNQTIYIKLEKNTERTYVSTTNIVNIDKLSLKNFTPTATSTTNSITVTASTEDSDATIDYGKSGLDGYRFSKDNGATWTDWQTSGTYTFTGLKQSTTFNIKVEAKDKAGNITEGKIDKTTGTVTALVKDANVTFSANTTSWTRQNVTVTASTTVSGFTLQTSINGTNWSNTGTQTRSTNGLVYARLWDGVNAGSHATCNITNIDKLEPNSFTVSTSTTTPTITVSASTTDKNATTEYGKSGISGYRFSKDNGSTWTGWQSSGSYTFTGLNPSTTYYIQVQAKDNTDNGGNITTVSTSATTLPRYTISYNANGGSGAPGSQTKDHNVNITLSGTVPTRSNYEFLGWSESSTGSVQYPAGGTYTKNENKTLYAIWKATVVTTYYSTSLSGHDNLWDAPWSSGVITTSGSLTINGTIRSKCQQDANSYCAIKVECSNDGSNWSFYPYNSVYELGGVEGNPAENGASRDVSATATGYKYYIIHFYHNTGTRDRYSQSWMNISATYTPG